MSFMCGNADFDCAAMENEHPLTVGGVCLAMRAPPNTKGELHVLIELDVQGEN